MAALPSGGAATLRSVADSASDLAARAFAGDSVTCPRCGTKMRKGAKACPNGHRLASESAMAARVREAVAVPGMRFRAELHPRTRAGKWRRTFHVQTPNGEFAGHVEENSETHEYRAVARTAPKGVLPRTFATPSQAKTVVLSHHYSNRKLPAHWAGGEHDVATRKLISDAHSMLVRHSKLRLRADNGEEGLEAQVLAAANERQAVERPLNQAGLHITPNGDIAKIGEPVSTITPEEEVRFWQDQANMARHHAVLAADPQEREMWEEHARKMEGALDPAVAHDVSYDEGVGGTAPTPNGETMSAFPTTEDLTTKTPIEIDTKLAELWGEQQQTAQWLAASIKHLEGSRRYLERTPDSPRYQRGVTEGEESVAKYRGMLADQQAKSAPFENEYARRPWQRYFHVTNGNGHVHKSMHCSTCFPTTQYNWLIGLADKPHDDMVKAYGEVACSTCFPDAPSMYAMLKASGQLSTRERETQNAKAARVAERAAKAAAKDAKKITMPDGSRLIDGHDWHMETEAAARSALTDAMIFTADPGRGGGNPTYQAGQKAYVERAITAISHKTGEAPETVRADHLAKAKKKAKRDGWTGLVWPDE